MTCKNNCDLLPSNSCRFGKKNSFYQELKLFFLCDLPFSYSGEPFHFRIFRLCLFKNENKKTHFSVYNNSSDNHYWFIHSYKFTLFHNHNQPYLRCIYILIKSIGIFSIYYHRTNLIINEKCLNQKFEEITGENGSS